LAIWWTATVGLEIAQHIAAAMEEHHYGKCRAVGRYVDGAIDAHGHVASIGCDHTVDYLGDPLRFPDRRRRQSACPGAGLLRRDSVEAGEVDGSKPIQVCLDLRVKRHGE
jgi:hypothetical protein